MYVMAEIATPVLGNLGCLLATAAAGIGRPLVDNSLADQLCVSGGFPASRDSSFFLSV